MPFAPSHPGDRESLEIILGVVPQWIALQAAGPAVGLDGATLLHAGPAFESPADITRPVLNSACVAAVFEGLAEDFAAAERGILDGELRLRPAQDFDVVTPLAAVVSASMVLQVVADRGEPANRAWAPLNGGNGPAPRLGGRSEAALAHLRWMNGELAQVLARALAQPLDLLALAVAGVAQGDDCHGRTPATTAALAAALDGGLGSDAAAARVREFLAAGPSFALNLWMAGCKCILNAARGVPGSSLVSAAGANGAHTAIQVAGLPGRWFTAPAAPPRGRFDIDLPAARALGAIGDSAIVDALGFGAMAMVHAPEQQKNLLEFMPGDGLALPDALLGAVHPAFAPRTLAVGLTARAVRASGRAPVVSLGILDRQGEAGRLGGGIFVQPPALFEAALAALEQPA